MFIKQNFFILSLLVILLGGMGCLSFNTSPKTVYHDGGFIGTSLPEPYNNVHINYSAIWGIHSLSDMPDEPIHLKFYIYPTSKSFEEHARVGNGVPALEIYSVDKSAQEVYQVRQKEFYELYGQSQIRGQSAIISGKEVRGLCPDKNLEGCEFFFPFSDQKTLVIIDFSGLKIYKTVQINTMQSSDGMGDLKK